MKDKAARWSILTVAVALLLASVWFVIQDSGPEVGPVSGDAELVSEVTRVRVVQVTPAVNTGRVQAWAEVRPQWNLPLQARVGGAVMELAVEAQAGERVNEGQLLLKIETAQWRAAVHQAEQTLAGAQLELALEKRRAQQLIADRRALGKNGGDGLALNEPQVIAAEKAVRAAHSQLQLAQRDFAATQVKAPFDGVILSRHVSPDQLVTAGQTLFQLASDGRLEVELRIGDAQWVLLDPQWRNQHAEIFSVSGQLLAKARVRGGGYRDQSTRQYILNLDVDSADANVNLMGAYVQVSLPAAGQLKSLSIPIGALTVDSGVWHLDEQSRLQLAPVEVLFHDQQQVIVRPRGAVELPAEGWWIVRRPQSVFLAGMLACSIEEGVNQCTP